MTKEELDNLYSLYSDIEIEEEEIRDQLAEITNKTSSGGYEIKIPEYGEEEEENEREDADLDINIALKEELELKLANILKVKIKIEKGGYGKCENCLKDIDDKRLKAMPSSPFCLDCSKLNELNQ